ncbi:hypothetical protein M1O51_05120, partial [Dehalococcoidia bacterium]|nr:hypothetical protein [Dehalococcoidia bacterium]
MDDDPLFGSPEFESEWIDVSTVEVVPADAALVDGTYHWRARAKDAAGNIGAWSTPWRFTVDTAPPPAPTLVLPLSGATLPNIYNPTLDWTDVFDPSAPVEYQVQVDDDPDFGSPAFDSGWITVSTATTTDLPAGTYYWWVRARDAADNKGLFSAPRQFTITDTIAPAAPTLVSPEDRALINVNIPTLDWGDVVDPSIPVEYRVQVDDDPDFGSPVFTSAWN